MIFKSDVIFCIFIVFFFFFLEKGKGEIRQNFTLNSSKTSRVNETRKFVNVDFTELLINTGDK